MFGSRVVDKSTRFKWKEMINILLTQESIKILEKERKRIVERQNELQIKVQECQDRKEAIDELLEQEIEAFIEDCNELTSLYEIVNKQLFVSINLDKYLKEQYKYEEE